MQTTCFVFAISRFDQPETWVVVLLAASESPLPSKAVVDRLGPASGRTAAESIRKSIGSPRGSRTESARNPQFLLDRPI
jgi:hypothetical protein